MWVDQLLFVLKSCDQLNAYLMTPHQEVSNERCCGRHVTKYLQLPQDGENKGIPVIKNFIDNLKEEDDQLKNIFPQKN